MKFILPIIALILLYALAPIAFIMRMFFGGRANYCKRIAVSLDQLGNVICDKLFNATMGSEFGSEDETISSVLGRNKQEGKLKPIGKFVASLLNFIDKNHVEKAIEKTRPFEHCKEA